MKRSTKIILLASLVAAALAPGCAELLGDYSVLDDGGVSSSGEAMSSSASTGAGGAGGSQPSGSGGGADAGDPDPCPPGSTAEMQDNFDDNTTGPEWGPFADGPQVTVAEANGELHITSDGNVGFGGYLWNGERRSLVGCHLGIEVKQISSEGIVAILELVNDTDPTMVWKLSMVHEGKGLVFRYSLNDVEQGSQLLLYNPVEHRFWRFRESQGTTFFETSPDGISWTVRHSLAALPFVGAVRPNLVVGVATAGGAGEVVFDNLNTIAP